MNTVFCNRTDEKRVYRGSLFPAGNNLIFFYYYFYFHSRMSIFDWSMLLTQISKPDIPPAYNDDCDNWAKFNIQHRLQCLFATALCLKFALLCDGGGDENRAAQEKSIPRSQICWSSVLTNQLFIKTMV